MTGQELGRAQRILGSLRLEVDSRTARVVHQDVQGEGVQNSVLTPSSVPPRSLRCWPEVGWPNQLEKTVKVKKDHDPTDPKNQAPSGR